MFGFAALAVQQENPRAALRLLAAAQTLGGPRSANLWTATRIEYEHVLALARDQITSTVFQAEQAAGQALSLSKAIDLALHLPLKTEPNFPKKPDDLTPR